MATKDKKDLDLANLEVAELEDDQLDDVAGGTNTCPIDNYNCPCDPVSIENNS